MPTSTVDAEPEDAPVALFFDAESTIVANDASIPDARRSILDARAPIPDARPASVDAQLTAVVDAQPTAVDAAVAIIAPRIDDAGPCEDELKVEYASVRDPGMGQVTAMRVRSASWTQELTRDGGPMTCTTKVRGPILEWQCSTDMGLAFGEVDVQSAFVVFREGFMTFGSLSRPPMRESARKPWSCPSPHFLPKNFSNVPHH